jgi:hypothetical protein
MLIRHLTAVSFSFLALLTSLEAFWSCSSRLHRRQIPYSGNILVLNVGTSPDRSSAKKTRSKIELPGMTANEDVDPYKSKTVVQLKALLKARGLAVSGVKTDLIARLMDSYDPVDASHLTDDGKLKIARCPVDDIKASAAMNQ